MITETGKDILLEDSEKLVELFQCAENLIGGKNFDEISGLTDEKLEKLAEIKTSILLNSINMVKKFGNRDFLLNMEEKWTGEHFWRMLNERLEAKTKLYLETADIRSMCQEAKEVLLLGVFKYYYIGRETTDFMSDEMKVDKCIVSAALKITRHCEYIYIFQHYSKRRFLSYLTDLTGLGDKEFEILWNAYYENHDKIERFALTDRIDLLDREVGRLNRKLEDLGETIELNSSMLFDLYGDDELDEEDGE